MIEQLGIEESKLQIGASTYKSSLNLSEYPQSLIENLSKVEWRMRGNTFPPNARQKLIQILKFVIESFVQSITINQFLFPYPISIVKEISSISFANLKEILYLGRNNICSIESISKINVEHLQSINLMFNEIVSVKSMRKCNFKNLNQLDLYGNRIKDPNYLAESTLGEEIDWISFEWLGDKNVCGEDCSYIAKFQPSIIKSFSLLSKLRISNQRIKEMLKNNRGTNLLIKK